MVESELERFIKMLGKLPGLGPRSGRRLALHLIKNKDYVMRPLAEAMIAVFDSTVTCEHCGNIDSISPCSVCSNPKRDDTTICVVEDVADLWAFERGSIFSGKYHILGGTLSALDGRGPSELKIDKLIERARAGNITEVIIATNATVEGQTTAHYLTSKLAETGVKISRLAYGIPIGGELDYLDEGTLGAALKSRQAF